MRTTPLRRTFSITLPFLLFLFASNTNAQGEQYQSQNPGFDVESVTLDKTLVYTECPGAFSLFKTCADEQRRVEISSKSIGNLENGMTYVYVPSGGKIIGEGRKVIWDFIGARPGNYSLTVGIGIKNIIRGKTVTKTVTVAECECDPPRSCPTISVSAPQAQVLPGNLIVFNANIGGGDNNELTHSWTVNNGKIVEGQGTSKILVNVNSDAEGKYVTAIYEAGGVAPDCLDKDSASAYVSVITQIKINEVKIQKPKSGFFGIEGYVAKIYECPPCPPDSVCKPCMREHLVISEKKKILKNYPIAKTDLIVFTNNSRSFEIGKKYNFIVMATDKKTTGEAINDFEIVNSSPSETKMVPK